RQMEVYRLEPNTTYEFRMWANNHLGSGEVVTTNVTTLPETKEEDLYHSKPFLLTLILFDIRTDRMASKTKCSKQLNKEYTIYGNVKLRQMEVYRLEPNTTYEFRMWANNHLGSGEVVTTNVTTLPETKEEDLIRLIQPDLDNFDPRIWIVAVSIVLGTFVILAIGLCIVLTRECYQSSQAGTETHSNFSNCVNADGSGSRSSGSTEFENGWDSIELIPNIILNPGFSETDDGQSPPIAAVPLPTFSRTIVFGDESDSCESESDHEPRMEKFKRKLSVFFTDPTIKRI
uniref:Uncharacterized protein n=1 Tax=Musca domestica TaxID=7370 RepID=A0A1I8M336_MUSDO